MFSRNKIIQIILALQVFSGLPQFSFGEELHDCQEALKQFHSSIERVPANLLIALEDGILRYESCSCELVHAAIVAAKSDLELIRQIVYTSVSLAPNLSNTIKDCALKTSPEAEDQILLGAAQALEGERMVASSSDQTAAYGGKETVRIYSGKDVVDVTSAKRVVPSQPQGDSSPDHDSYFYLAPLQVGGVYLISGPAGPVLTPTKPDKPKKEDCECPDIPISPTQAVFRSRR